MRRLAEVHVARGFVEIAPRRRLDAIGIRTEEHPVQVHRKDLVLGDICCSSQTASSTSCTLRSSVRSGDRNRFLASCWVSVEPPCTMRPVMTLVSMARRQAERIDAEMRIEAAVLDGDDRLGNIGRHVFERQRLAAGRAAIGDDVAARRHGS